MKSRKSDLTPRWSLSPAILALALGWALLVPTASQAEPNPAYVKDLKGRVGVGYSNELANLVVPGGVDTSAISSISLKYGLKSELTLQGLLGFLAANGDDYEATGFNLGAKVYYNLVREQNMIFYLGGGVGLGTLDVTVTTPSSTAGAPPQKSGEDYTSFSLLGAVGIEYFIPWFPNVGFNFEYSVGLTLTDNYWIFGMPNPTGGQQMAHVGSFGFHYYFLNSPF